MGALRLAMTYPPNFNPIGAMALFGGAVLASKRLAYLIPLGALLVTDILMGLIRPDYFDYFLMKFGYSIPFVYLAFALTVYLGQRYLKSQRSMGSVIVLGFASGALFFLLSNFGTWLGSPIYPQNIGGLLACYGAGLAFYKNDIASNFALNTIVSTMLFSVAAFAAYNAIEKVFHKQKEVA